MKTDPIDISDPRAYVGMIAAHHTLNKPPCITPAQFIHRHGVSYNPEFGQCDDGPIKNCYGNAADLALGEYGLTYVEGWATPGGIGLAVEHAWCVDRDGKVYDPTWTEERKNRGCAYFGVPVPAHTLKKVLLTTRMQGVFAQWWNWSRILPILEQSRRDGGKKKKAA